MVTLAVPVACTQEDVDTNADLEFSGQVGMDTRAVYHLLDLMDTLVSRNPAHEQARASIANATGVRRERMMQGMAQRNDDDYDLNMQIDSLLALPAYDLYYAQFNNMDREKHRAIFYALPFYAPQSPGDIGSHLFELCLNRGAVRTWVDSVLVRIDLQRSHAIARQWLPEGEYTIPTIRFIYDGNGDAFARAGEVCFDLYSIVISRRPDESRFHNLGDVGIEEIEGVLAHEMQHVYANPYLYPSGRTFDSWQQRQMDGLIRRFVSEGVAMQCNPPSGFRREVKEDSFVVAYWIDQLNQTFTALRDGTITEEEFQDWYRKTYQATARMVLEKYGKRRYPDVPFRKFVVEHQLDRPTLVYTLGWWLITHILHQEDGKAKVIGLLSDPAPLFELYNQSLAEAEAAFRVTP